MVHDEGTRAEAAHLSIGALSRLTGIPVETLRTWEARYGFPSPERRPSGQRRYGLDTAARLRKVVELLRQGHRPCDVVSATDAVLDELARSARAGAVASTELPVRPTVDVLLPLVARHDSDRLTAALLRAWATDTPIDFLERTVAPLVTAVGDSWAAGALRPRHEHLFSEALIGLLRALRQPADGRARGPIVALATLPGEPHRLGLEMAALALATAGARVHLFGAELPPAELAALCADVDARALGVSVSRATAGRPTRRLVARLRRVLRAETVLLVGGEGSRGLRRVRGVEPVETLRDLEGWARRPG